MKCDEVRQYFIDYLEDNLTTEEKLNINIHLEGCSECRAELLELKSLVNEINENKEEINVPVDFMDKIRERALKINNPEAKRKKRPLKVFFIAAVILTLSVGTVFADKFPFAELFKLMNPEPRIENIVDKGKGDRLNISKIDKDIKITITDVVADNLQTLISYKIEDLKSGKEYRVKYNGGIDIKERWVKQIEDTDIEMYTSMFSKEGKGILTLYPIDTEKKTINLSFNELETKVEGSLEEVEGNWSFEIPIKKYEGKTYDIKASVKIDDYTIYFNNITIAPTLTKLSFSHTSGTNKNVELIGLEDVRIVANGREYKHYNFGHGDWNPYSSIGFGDSEMTFESMYFDDPKNLEIKISRINKEITEEEPKEFSIKLDETAPQEFDYLGTKLYVENLKVGEEITFDLKQPIYNKHREILSINFYSVEGFGSEKYFSTGGNYTKVYYIDNDNNKYEFYDALLNWDEIRGKNPAMYIENTNWRLKPVDGFDIKKEDAIKMNISGYRKTIFVDESVKVKLK